MPTHFMETFKQRYASHALAAWDRYASAKYQRRDHWANLNNE